MRLEFPFNFLKPPLLACFLFFFVENVPFPLEAGEDAQRSGRKHLLCRLHDLAVSHRGPLRSLVSRGLRY